MSLNQGQELNQRYRVVSLIGQGGFGAVYRAWDLTLKRPCAVKENLDTSAEAQKQFDREVQLLSNLHHSNLPRIYDYFFLPGMGQYLVMDFIEGQNLQTMLETRGPLPEAEVVPWMRQICDALAYMHSQNPPVIHRDIKPANIIITPQGRAVLVDFGISKIYDTHLKTTVGARAVTPGFSPWEQYGQGTTDTRSDIYALGATLYVLLTGQEPPESIALMGGMATLTPPRQINRAITPHVAQVIEHAMQTRPTERFAAAAALGQALLQYTPAVSTSLTPSSLTPSQPSPYALLGWVLGVGGIGILLLVTVLVIGISLGRNQNNRTGTLVEASTIITPSTNTELTNEPTYQSTTLPVTTIVPTITSLSLPTATTTRRLTQTPSLTPTIALGIGSIQLADKDGMIQVYIPDGEFIMGTNNGLESEMPVHAVYLDDYWIDQTEVTNSMYAQCVAVNYCQPPAINSSYTRTNYYGNTTYDDYPVIYVSWYDANNYCEWVGRRLPTEAEWEKAARGTDEQEYPWGNQFDGIRLNFCDSNCTYESADGNINDEYSDTSPVGYYSQGISPYGAFDMAGNVWEWVADFWGDYPSGSVSNPQGPDSSTYRIYRGGGWDSSKDLVRSTFRGISFDSPSIYYDYLGFRCAEDE